MGYAAMRTRPVLSPGPTARSARGTQIRIANAGTSGRAANTVIQARSRPKANRLASCLRGGDPFSRERVMLAPGVPHRCSPPANRRRVLLGRGFGDVGDRHVAARARDRGLFDVTRARQPALDALVHLLRAAVLDRDSEAGKVRDERTAGEDVPVVLTRVTVDGETPHRGVARVLESAKAEVIEELLARIAATD